MGGVHLIPPFTDRPFVRRVLFFPLSLSRSLPVRSNLFARRLGCEGEGNVVAAGSELHQQGFKRCGGGVVSFGPDPATGDWPAAVAADRGCWPAPSAWGRL